MEPNKERKPNFLVIVADDLGWSDPGCFGGEIKTPHIDRLAIDGCRFSNFYAAAACSPTRAMLMTGTDHHIAGLGNLIEWARAPHNTKLTAVQRGIPGYEGYLNDRVVALPELLNSGGYETFMAGKWHLGMTKKRSPKERGFERSYAMLAGSCNHYAYEPPGAKENTGGLEQSYIACHLEEDQWVKSSDLPADWYSSQFYAEKMVEYLQDRTARQEKRPFFGYLAFTAPHWPLQAPREYIEHYRGVYDKGPDELRRQRLARMVEMGLMDPGTRPHPVVANEVKTWEEMSDLEKAKSSRAMETYAGMVECMDHNIGKVLAELERQGELDNTLIIFMSDNGAEGAALEASPLAAGGLLDHLCKFYNNSLDNIGNKDSFVWYGPRWAQAATAPSRLYKANTTEGGVRVPMVARFPKFHNRETTDVFATVMDIMPTILQMAGISHPVSEWKGREIAPMRGLSMLDWALSKTTRIHDQDFIQGWELMGRAAIRKGFWKAVFIPKPKGPEKWQLYNLEKDPGEIDDLAEQESAKLVELLKLWDAYVEDTGVIPLMPELGEYVEALEEQMTPNGWMEYEYWHPGAVDEPEKFHYTPPKIPHPRNRSAKA